MAPFDGAGFDVESIPPPVLVPLDLVIGGVLLMVEIQYTFDAVNLEPFFLMPV